MLDKLIKLTTLISTILIFNGVLYLTIYYQSFGIKIFSYLQFSEIITAFLDNITMILVFFGIYLLTSGLGVFGLTKTVDIVGSMPELDKQKTIKYMFSAYKITWVIKLIITLIVTLLITANYMIFKIWMIYFLSILFFDVVGFIFEKLDSILIKSSPNSQYRLLQNILIFIVPFTLFTIMIAQFNAMKTKQNTQGITIIQKDDCNLYTGKYDKLIGKTNNYIFLYDSDNRSSISISLADVKAIEYH